MHVDGQSNGFFFFFFFFLLVPTLSTRRPKCVLIR